MDTIVLKIQQEEKDREKLRQAAKILRKGGLVAFPTETVYGLGANGLDPEATAKIYEAKGRPSDNPLILHISRREDLVPLVKEIPPVAEKLMECFWPGPLTLIFKKSALVPKRTTGGLDTVAIRMPSHPIAHGLIEEAKVPIAAPSANLSGKPSPTKAEHVMHDLMGRIDMIIAGPASNIGLESTVVDVTTAIPTILRPGGITYEQLKKTIGKTEIDKGIQEDLKETFKPKAPGMKYTHYAPSAPMTIVQGPRNAVIEKINKSTEEYIKQGKKVGILATEDNVKKYSKGLVLSLGKRDKPESIAANLFALLRQLDLEGVDVIFAEGITSDGIGMAIVNRMNKAAGHRIVQV
ncbi:L-threonylcarbamoyladenylate synthase [Garciella nitratireducens]|uniref:L-threonylcarbamoyladenylate synthase n=1 Tax=Garciella nitratireducens TaxID=218205 RepID=UPI001BD2803D|nr:L-threonylcarbamoyladenylate synthase [Garciella nitratireducens]